MNWSIGLVTKTDKPYHIAKSFKFVLRVAYQFLPKDYHTSKLRSLIYRSDYLSDFPWIYFVVQSSIIFAIVNHFFIRQNTKFWWPFSEKLKILSKENHYYVKGNSTSD